MVRYANLLFSRLGYRSGLSEVIIYLCVSISSPLLMIFIRPTFITFRSTSASVSSSIIELDVVWPLFLRIDWGILLLSIEFPSQPGSLFALLFFPFVFWWHLHILGVFYCSARSFHVRSHLFIDSYRGHIIVNVFSWDSDWILFWESICIHITEVIHFQF